MAGPKKVGVCEWGPDGAGRVTLILKMAVDDADELAKTNFLGFLKPNGCASLLLSLTDLCFVLNRRSLMQPNLSKRKYMNIFQITHRVCILFIVLFLCLC